MKFNPKERIGVSQLALAVASEFEWIFREQTISDVGIDGHIELVTDGKAQGKLIAVQVKTGDSYLQQSTGGKVFYGDKKHLDYWLNHTLPVLLVVFTPADKSLRWVDIRPDNIERTNKGWKVVFPKNQIFDRGSLAKLLAVFDQAPKYEEYQGATSIARNTLSGLDGHVSFIVNDIAADLQIYNWYSWVQEACCAHIPTLPENFVEGARSARVKIPSWIFPEDSFSDVFLSASNMIHKANYAADLLLEEAEYEEHGKIYRGVHAYKRQYPNPNYASENLRHVAWAANYVVRFKAFVKAANLFCEVVREQLDPSFLLRKGRLMFSDDFINWSETPEYSPVERRNILKNSKSLYSGSKLKIGEKSTFSTTCENLNLAAKPVIEFNEFLENGFGNGPCTCIRCKASNGDQAGYKHQHTFCYERFQANRRFASASSSDNFVQLLENAWWCFTNSDMVVTENFSLNVAKEFVRPELHELLEALLVANGLIKSCGGGQLN